MMKPLLVFLFSLFFVGCTTDSSGPISDGTGINDPSVAPAVYWTDPLDGAVGPNIMSPGNVVIIRFTKVMNTRSVIRAVSISPSNQSVYIDTNRASPVDGLAFDFPLTPTPYWLIYTRDPLLDQRYPPAYQIYYPSFKVGQVYTVTVAASAQDFFGNAMGSPQSFSFTPEPYFRVTNTYPQNNDTMISPLSTSLNIRFNAVIDTSSAGSSLTVAPQVSGTASVYYGDWGFSWSSPANTMMASETKYTATIAATVKDTMGHSLLSPYSFSFTTAPYSVTYGYPSGTGASVGSDISIECNFLIDSATVVPAFTTNPTVSGTFQCNTSSFVFRPSSLLTPNKSYTVSVSTALHALGGIPMKTPYTLSFTTGSQ